MAKYIAIDFGLRRIGLAIADEMLAIATPLKTVEYFGGIEKAIEKIIEELKPYEKELKAIVVGLPLLMSGKDSDMTKTVREFAEKLKNKVAVDIHLFDERLTTAQLDKMMRDADVKRKKRNQSTDPLAAALILQCFLDAQANRLGGK